MQDTRPIYFLLSPLTAVLSSLPEPPLPLTCSMSLPPGRPHSAARPFPRVIPSHKLFCNSLTLPSNYKLTIVLRSGDIPQ